MIAGSEADPKSFSTLFAWAVYLACSWTWCIGMYLPVVLMDHYGIPAVLAFAIPNIAGVVLFAFGVKTVAASRALTAGHAPAMLWFSLTTIAFHVYFLAAVWRYEFPGSSAALAILVPAPVVLLAWLARGLSDRLLVRAALGVYLLSWIMMTLMTFRPLGLDAPIREAVWAARPESGLVFLVPVFIIGFLLCPFLDLTFHRALVAVGGRGPGKTTFALFGIVFAFMLWFTLLYAGVGFRWPVVLHILVQSWFTMTVHFKEIESRRHSSAGEAVGRRVWPVLAVSWLLVVLPFVDYRWWFLFTGLVFPVYVVLMMVRPRLGAPSAHQVTLAVVILLLTPFSALGFLVAEMEWLALAPCVTMVLALFVGREAPAAKVVEASPAPPASAG